MLASELIDFDDDLVTGTGVADVVALDACSMKPLAHMTSNAVPVQGLNDGGKNATVHCRV
jgi:hypothetical protein